MSSGEADDYDEFGMLGDNAAEAGLSLGRSPKVTRSSFTVAEDQTVSALTWGETEPWRYDLFDDRPAAVAGHTALWADVAAITAPVMLVLGGDSPFVPGDDLAEFRRLLPAARVEVVPDAGHAIQSDQPLLLTQLIEDFIF